MDRLTSLTVFARVVENGGFSAAARRLNMSTTMVSNHVQSLEDHLGARLLNRTTRKVSLTEVGRVYYERCTQILSDIEEADGAAGALQATPTGTLRIYTSTHIVRFIAPLVAEFLAAYPDVSIEFSIGERMVDLIEEGFDLAIRTLRPQEFQSHRPTSGDLEACPVLRAELSGETRRTEATRRSGGPQLPALRVLSVR